MTQVDCSKCGVPNPADDTHCAECGASLASAEASPEARASPEVAPKPPAPAEMVQEVAPSEEAVLGVAPSPEGSTEAIPAPEAAPAAKSSPEIETYYSDEGVRVTNLGAVFASRIYGVAEMTSVSQATKAPDRLLSVVVSVAGVLIVIIALTDVFGDAQIGVTLVVGGLVLLGVGLLLLMTARTSYIVRLEIISGEVDALVSPDQERVQAIVNAIDKALGQWATTAKRSDFYGEDVRLPRKGVLGEN